MSDYNDGNWHAWNGGECPVHPESEVEVVDTCKTKFNLEAKCFNWSNPLLFRVTNPYVEPKVAREVYVIFGKHGVSYASFETPCLEGVYGDAVLFREVLDNE